MSIKIGYVEGAVWGGVERMMWMAAVDNISAPVWKNINILLRDTIMVMGLQNSMASIFNGAPLQTTLRESVHNNLKTTKF